MTNPGTPTDRDQQPRTGEAETGAQLGILTITWKCGERSRLTRVPVTELKRLHGCLPRPGFAGWCVVMADGQSLAVNVAEVAAIHFAADDGRVRA